MKKCIKILFALLFGLIYLPGKITAQVPEKMSYQAVVRDNENKLVRNSLVQIQISILQDTVTGDPLYIETHAPISNDNGLVTLDIGSGQAVVGHFSEIDWSKGPLFLKTEADLSGSYNYTIIGTSRFLSVPYAFHAKTADNVANLDGLIDSVLNNTVILNISPSDTLFWNNKQDVISGSEPVFQNWDKNASDDFTGNYNDLAGKPQNLSDFNNDEGYISSESDPEFSAWDKSTGITITQNQVADLSFDLFEKELSDDETSIDVGFGLLSTTIVFINGTAIPSNKWAGIGTQSLNLLIEIKKYDKLKVKK